MQDTDWLATDEVIKDTSSASRYSNYRPGPAWPELEEQYRDKLAEYRPLIENVCEALGDMRPEQLELISTLVFSYRWVRARGGSGPWRSAVIEKFMSIKEDKFTDQDIDHWYGALSEASLIEN